MIAISLRRATVGLALLAMFGVATETNAACCGGGTTAYYPSSYNTYYGGSYAAAYPTTYQTYSSGWYPGYYWNQVRARLWGSPSTYVAAYPTTTYAASYAPTHSVSYAPTYSASYSPAYATSYAAPAAYAPSSTCSSCTAGYAPVQQVTMRPACAPCSPCAACPTCPVPTAVTQTSYQQPACECAAAPAQQNVTTSSSTPTEAPPQTFDPSTSTNGGSSDRPSVPADSGVPVEREEQKPPVNGTDVQPAPGDDDEESKEFDPYDTTNSSSDSSTYFEAPKLHDPNDRTAQRGVSTVKTAVYKQPVSYRSVSTQRVTDEQARQDAIGWTSVSN
jgi:hypothetical protein